ncbi:MAG: small ribosomal subunit Rsm22 family protein [Rectinemataceae bacterium]
MRKRSRPHQGTDEPRDEKPGQEEPRPAPKKPAGEAPPSPASPTGDAEPQRPQGGRRRRFRRGGDRETRQAALFDGLDEGKSGPPPGAEAQAEAGKQNESAETRKSRSKRRRERRGPGGERGAGEKPGSERGGTPDETASSPKPAFRTPSADQRRGKTGARPRPESRASHGSAEHRDFPNRDRALRGTGTQRRGGAERGRPELGRERPREGGRDGARLRGGERDRNDRQGLPAFTEEDLGALNRMGEEAFQHRGSNASGRPVGHPAAPTVRPLETLSPSAESLAAIAALEAIIDESSPLQPKHRAGLRGDIRQLWEELTSDRESRSNDYLGSPPALSAYLRYFLPWNVYRLSAILSNADFCLPDNAVVVDIGSGPLTVVIALWAARPELRDIPLTIYCLDRVERIMEAGKNIFETLCLRLDGRIPPWRIVTRKESFGGTIPEKAHLLTAANVFNEFFWKDRRNLGERALETAHTLLQYMRENGSIFIMEPGDPRSGAFISSLRAALLAEGAPPLGPCPHALSCPMPGIFRHLLPPEETRTVKGDPNVAPSRFVLPPVTMPKKRDKFPWCHFGIDTSKAPAWLQNLSEEAGLPKEKATLSYLWSARGAIARLPVGIPDPVHATERERRARAGKGILVRVVSEPFALPDGTSGQYACSSLGYTLLKRQRDGAPFDSGNLLEVTASPLAHYDDKSGAIILPT